ncbi:MAG TPA: hypothetical protein EYO59_00450, partial [Chromatiaceae bacterium]|nr:hypothetical protein [Chromatiaceae bacterium]
MTQDMIVNPTMISTLGGDVTITADFGALDTAGFEWAWSADNHDVFIGFASMFQDTNVIVIPAEALAKCEFTLPDETKIPCLELNITLKTSETLDPGQETERVQKSEATIALLITTQAVTAADVEDVDGDGVPDSMDQTALPNELQTDLGPDSPIMMTTVGQTLALGKTARCAGSGAMLTFEQILAASGPNCGPTQDGDTSLALETAIGGIFDFVIGGLGVDIDPATNVAIPATGYVVLPLGVPIPTNAFYQKFTDGTGWADFVIDDDNGAIYSASSGGGDCPAIPADAEGNSEAYTAGLTVGDNCVLLSIVDGGANDADNKVNGQIVDPGTISRIAGDEGVVDNPSSSGGCTLST